MLSLRNITKQYAIRRDEPDSDDETCSNSDHSVISEDGAPTLLARADFTQTYMSDKKLLKHIQLSKGECLIQCMKLENYGQETFENQQATALAAVEIFKIRSKVIQVVVGRTQSGKTGCMLEFIKLFITENMIPIENIYLITGLSSKDWEIQCKGRFPDCLNKNIYHNGQMTRFYNDVQGKKNVLVLVDEAHLACLKKQTMNTIFKELNWKLDFMMENDIKFIQFSATPDGILFALNQPKWPKDHYHVHTMESGNGYYGAPQMLQNDQLRLFKNIIGRNKKGEWLSDPNVIYDNIQEILDAQLSFPQPRYMVFRILGGYDQFYQDNIITTINTRLSLQQQMLFDTNIRTFCMEGNVENINALLYTTPSKHTIIFIKEKMKCAQTLEHKITDKTHIVTTHNVKHNIGVMIERWSKSVDANRGNDSFIIQGLLGRLCGYNQHDVICFTNLSSVEKYEELFITNFDEELVNSIGWNSNSTRGNTSGLTKTKITFNAPEERIDPELEEHVIIQLPEPNIVRFITEEEAINYCREVLKVKARRLKKNEYGFYLSTIRSHTKVWNEVESYEERRWGLNAKTRIRLRACYSDINDINTVQFWVIHH